MSIMNFIKEKIHNVYFLFWFRLCLVGGVDLRG